MNLTQVKSLVSQHKLICMHSYEPHIQTTTTRKARRSPSVRLHGHAAVGLPHSLHAFSSPLLLFECLSLTIFAFWNVAYFVKALVRMSSLTSLPMSPTNIRKSFSAHSDRVGSYHFCPAAARGTALLLSIFGFPTLP